MAIKVGDRLPDAVLRRMGPDGPEEVRLADRLKGRRVAMFAVPGAFTPTCHSAHMPSFVRNADAFRAKGVDEIICISVNDVHVMRVWGEVTGATEAGITLLSDTDGAFSRAIEMSFDAPATGMFGRSKRYACFVEDGVVTIWNPEISRGCEISGGEALLSQIAA
jgi:cytochrome c peroxidase